MNIHQSYALTSRPDTNQLLRWWKSFTHTALFCAICLTDVAVIVTMAWLTGTAYHLLVYRHGGELASFLEVGTLAAGILHRRIRPTHHVGNPRRKRVLPR